MTLPTIGGYVRDFPDAEELARREDVRSALEAVYHGADSTDADALLDRLEDHGLRVVRA